MNNLFKKGDSVVFINESLHQKLPRRFPSVETIGTVIAKGSYECLVQWPKGSTSGDDLYRVKSEDIVNIKTLKNNKREYYQIIEERRNDSYETFRD